MPTKNKSKILNTLIDEKSVLQELESLGTEQHRKTYKRHGSGEKVFGVSYANFNKLQKKYKNNSDLAEKLWDSKIHDARVLAIMIADPQNINEKIINRWALELQNHWLSDALAGLIAKTPYAQKKAEVFIADDDEWRCSAGWGILARLARESELPDSYFESYLKQIEKNIQNSKNWVKYAMNSTLISVGIRNNALETKVFAIAKKIGKVEVDHGDTSCKTPDVIPYIQKTKKHRKSRAKTKN